VYCVFVLLSLRREERRGEGACGIKAIGTNPLPDVQPSRTIELFPVF
jgi:hypothetical protein